MVCAVVLFVHARVACVACAVDVALLVLLLLYHPVMCLRWSVVRGPCCCHECLLHVPISLLILILIPIPCAGDKLAPLSVDFPSGFKGAGARGRKGHNTQQHNTSHHSTARGIPCNTQQQPLNRLHKQARNAMRHVCSHDAICSGLALMHMHMLYALLLRA